MILPLPYYTPAFVFNIAQGVVAHPDQQLGSFSFIYPVQHEGPPFFFLALPRLNSRMDWQKQQRQNLHNILYIFYPPWLLDSRELPPSSAPFGPATQVGCLGPAQEQRLGRRWLSRDTLPLELIPLRADERMNGWSLPTRTESSRRLKHEPQTQLVRM